MLNKEAILQFKIFEGITLEELEAIFNISQEISYKSGEVILDVAVQDDKKIRVSPKT